MAVRQAEEFHREGETLGDFLYRIAAEEVFTEENTDALAGILATILEKVVPLPFVGKFVGWGASKAIDSQMPEVALWVVREILQRTGMLSHDSRFYHPDNPFR